MIFSKFLKFFNFFKFFFRIFEIFETFEIFESFFFLKENFKNFENFRNFKKSTGALVLGPCAAWALQGCLGVPVGHPFPQALREQRGNPPTSRPPSRQMESCEQKKEGKAARTGSTLRGWCCKAAWLRAPVLAWCGVYVQEQFETFEIFGVVCIF